MSDVNQKLAEAFSARIRDALTYDELREVIARNKAEADSHICHSHDFIDANMEMAPAFEAVMGREPDVGSEDDAAIWNAAWNIAVNAQFFA